MINNGITVLTIILYIYEDVCAGCRWRRRFCGRIFQSLSLALGSGSCVCIICIIILWGQGQGWWHMSCGGITCG